MNVLVTGSSGFVGRNLTERLLEKGYKVYGFDRLLMRGFRVRNHRNFNQRKVDLHSFSSVLRACRTIQNVKYVFHTVAIQPSGIDMEISEYLDTNLIGAVNLLKACKICGFNNIIVSSSFSVYGKPEYLPVDEKHPTMPANIYGLTKLQADLLFEFYSRKMDFNVVILRYDGIYGVGQTIPGFIQYLIGVFSKEEDVELFNYGKQIRDNVFVDDVVQANLKAMKIIGKKKFSIFNIGGAEPKSSAETAQIIKKALGSKSRVVLSKKKNLLMGYDVFMDNSKARKLLGYKTKGLRQNVIKMLREVKKNA